MGAGGVLTFVGEDLKIRGAKSVVTFGKWGGERGAVECTPFGTKREIGFMSREAMSSFSLETLPLSIDFGFSSGPCSLSSEKSARATRLLGETRKGFPGLLVGAFSWVVSWSWALVGVQAVEWTSLELEQTEGLVREVLDSFLCCRLLCGFVVRERVDELRRLVGVRGTRNTTCVLVEQALSI